jgi:drug/metabolite transporter (DMT)-like permease
MTLAMQYAPASHAAVVLAALPLLTAMAGALVARERPSPGFWVCGIAGTAAAAMYAVLSGGGAADLHWADLLLGAAALSAAMAYALGGEMSHRIGGWEVISWALVVSAPALLLAFVILAPPINWGASAAAWGGFLYVALFSQFLGFFAWNKGLSLGGIARIGQLLLLQPFVTLVAASLLLGELIGWMEVVFCVVVVMFVALGWRMRVSRTP